MELNICNKKNMENFTCYVKHQGAQFPVEGDDCHPYSSY